MLRQRLLNKEVSKNNRDAIVISESRLATAGLIISLIILASKLFYNNRESLHNLIYEHKLISYEILNEEGRTMFKYAWTNTIKYSRFWFPLICGFLTTYFTWLMVYLDSNIPGVQPPSPFSPTKYKVQSGHTFHLNYMFAIIVGSLVSGYLYWRGAQL